MWQEEHPEEEVGLGHQLLQLQGAQRLHDLEDVLLSELALWLA
jgi:hypothetical protein